VAEVADAGEDHRQARLVRGGDDFIGFTAGDRTLFR
jgi:hypothetical protein